MPGRRVGSMAGGLLTRFSNRVWLFFPFGDHGLGALGDVVFNTCWIFADLCGNDTPAIVFSKTTFTTSSVAPTSTKMKGPVCRTAQGLACGSQHSRRQHDGCRRSLGRYSPTRKPRRELAPIHGALLHWQNKDTSRGGLLPGGVVFAYGESCLF
jgi:hypothetical protein